MVWQGKDFTSRHGWGSRSCRRDAASGFSLASWGGVAAPSVNGGFSGLIRVSSFIGRRGGLPGMPAASPLPGRDIE